MMISPKIRMIQFLYDGETVDADRALCVAYDAQGAPVQVFEGDHSQTPDAIIKSNFITLPFFNITANDFDAWLAEKEILDGLMDESKRRCPKCASSKDVKRIVYGYAPKCAEGETPGGCCVGPQKWACLQCRVAFWPERPH